MEDYSRAMHFFYHPRHTDYSASALRILDQLAAPKKMIPTGIEPVSKV